MKIGLMGGTFDPIHLGHLRAAESAREHLGLDRIVFVPAGAPPHRADPLTAPRDRFAMVALATAGHSGFVVSDAELTRDGPSYTVDTVRWFLARHPDDSLVVIVGSDAFAEMRSWKQPQELFSLCGIAVVARPGGPQVADQPHARVATAVEGPTLPISASLVRGRVAAGGSVSYLVPPSVAEYIVKRELYR